MKPVCPANQSPAETGDRAYRVREATVGDLPGIVSVHQEAFSNFFLTRLGSRFLQEYYGLVLRYHSGIVLVSERRSAIQGFACGFVNPAEFYRLMWRARRRFALPVLSAVLRDPSMVTRVLSAVRRIQMPPSAWPARACELSSIAIAPETAGNGFGKALMRAFLAQAQSMEAHCVYLTTDADNNDAANAFYRDAGFQHTRRFLQSEGRWMNEYVIHRLGGGDACDGRV